MILQCVFTLSLKYPLKANLNIQHIGVFLPPLFIDFTHFHLNPPACLFDPPEQRASASGLAGFSARLHLVSRQVGNNPTHTKGQVGARRQGMRHAMVQNDTIFPVFAFTMRTHDKLMLNKNKRLSGRFKGACADVRS